MDQGRRIDQRVIEPIGNDKRVVKKSGCRGCIGRGCGCLGVAGIALFAWLLWPGSTPEAPTKANLWPATSKEITYSRDLEYLMDDEGMHTPAGLLQPLIDETGLSHERAISVTKIATGSGVLVVFETDEARDIFAHLEARGYTPLDQLGDLTSLTSARTRPFGTPTIWLLVNDRLLAAGSAAAVEEFVDTVERRQPNLLQARPELTPFFYHLDSSKTLWAVLQDPDLERSVGTLPPVIAAIKGGLGPLASLLTIQVMGDAGDIDEDSCRARIAQLYGSRVAAFTVARLHLFLRILNGLAGESDSEAQEMSTFRAGRFVSLDMTFDRGSCESRRVDEKKEGRFVDW